MKPTKLFTYLPFVILFVSSCSHTKRSEIGQGAQNFNSRYNTYFNAREKFYIGYNKVKDNCKDNYSELLPLFELEHCQDKFMAQSDMNIIEEKAGKVSIKYYTSRWADNAILLWGKTLFLRGEYEKSIKVFTYITAAYKKGWRNEDLRKPKDGKVPKKEQEIREAEKTQIPITEGFFEHSPRRNEAMLWLARAYTNLEKFNEAQAIISYAESDMTFPQEYRTELIKVQADLYIKRQNYPEALKYLSQLIDKTKSKKQKARYYYISGQLYELTHKADSTYTKFNNVLSNNPDDEMEFYTRMKLANAAAGMNVLHGEQILLKMLKEDKNEDYFDIIYYKLGVLQHENNNDNKAVEYLNQSIDISKNDKQKAQSFKLLGQIYTKKDNYIIAKQYNDSAIALYDQKLKDYRSFVDHAKIIEKLAAQQQIVQDQDSLIYLASLGKEKAEKLLLKDLNDKKIALEKSQTAAKTGNINNFKPIGNDKWYFGNVSLVMAGNAEFKKNWGDRKLEDNWRRKNKRQDATSGSDENKTADSSAPELSIEEQVKKKVSEIPFEPAALQATTQKKQQALYEMGVIYKDDLNEFNRSIATVEPLEKEINNKDLLPKVYFQLYINHSILKYDKKAAYYKSLLQKDFPKHALTLSFEKKDTVINHEELYYDTTFACYQREVFDTTLERCNMYAILYPKEVYKLKIKLLKATSLGMLHQYDDYIKELNDLAGKYSDTKEGKMAQDLLARFMNSNLPRLVDSFQKDSTKPISYNPIESKLQVVGKQDTASKILPLATAKKDSVPALITSSTAPVLKKDSVKVDTPKVQYELNMKAPHHFLLVLTQDKTNEDLQVKIGNYNAKNFNVLNLKVLAMKLGNQPVYLIQEFTDGSKASFYQRFILSDKDALSGLNPTDYQVAIISSANLAKMIPAKDVAGYIKYYKENYKN